MKQSLLDKPLSNFLQLDWEKALYILIIVLALATRLWALGDRVQSHDESLHTKFSWDLYVGNDFGHTPMMHGPFLFHITALSYQLFDDNDFTARLPVALMGVLLVAFPWLLRHWLGRAGALAASFFLLISPSLTYYSRYIRHDIPIILWSMIIVWAMLSYLRDGRERWLYLMAAGISLTFATKEVAFIYNATFGIFLVVLFAIQALKQEWSGNLRSLFLSALTIIVIGLLVLGIGVLLQSEEQQAPALWAIIGGILATIALAAAAVILLIATWHDLRTSRYRVFDLIVVLGTLCLPLLLVVPLFKLAGLDPTNYNWITNLLQPTSTGSDYLSLFIIFVAVTISAAIGIYWNPRRWSISAAIYYIIFAVLFTTIFTNVNGIASGMTGSLGYWLAQQEVERGGQPWYYYLLMVPLYEYLPLLLALIAPVYYAVRKAFSPRSSDSRFPLVPFFLWWIVAAWGGYSYAGEKMPWLTVHLALPMILLAAWLLGQLIERIDWPQVLERRAWLLALVAPPFVAALIMLIKAVLAGPFQGYEALQLETTGLLLGGLAGTLAFGVGMAYAVYHSGWPIAARILLLVILLLPVLLTIRTTYRFCYVNYDYPTEFLVYAHAGQAVKETMSQIDELSRRTAGGSKLIKVAYGSDGSWPFNWYLRDYPNAVFYGGTPSREQLDAPIVIAGRDEWEEVTPYMDRDYIVNTYTFLWWPMEDYRDLTWDRVTRAITDTQTRSALWDIWYDRDYRSYDALTGKSHTLATWPLRNEYRLYIRRDVAAQVWDIGTVAEPEVEIITTDSYAQGWQELSARQVFGDQGTEPGQFERPNGIAIDAQGFVYVADTGNHRIQKFTADGQFVAAWERGATVETDAGVVENFNEPWSIALAPGGNVYVADTWNHFVQKLDADGSPLTAWGTFGQFSTADAAGQSAFYGPRGVAVGADGRVYVADTGNKRVQVFDPDGQFDFQWGGGGVLDGYLEEPVGIATGPDGVYVADTWNHRVQVFDAGGLYLRQWPIAGWDTNQVDEKPYLAVDQRGYVYVTDPGYYRVLVFDDLGNYVLSFGQYGLDEQSFALPTGIAVAEDGSVYVVDSYGARVLVFDALDLE